MGLKTFTIKRLFNKHDVTIKCDQKCVILLGSNGVGKSTALRILYYYLTGNMADIIFVPFRSIVIVYDDEKTREVLYSDLLPSVDYMTKEYSEYLRRNEYDMPLEEAITASQIGNLKTIDTLVAEFREALEELVRINKYGDLIYSLYSHKSLSVAVRQIMERSIDISELQQLNMVKTVGCGIENFEGTDNSRIFAISKSEKCLWFDAVKSYSISNEILYKSYIYDPDLEWIYSDKKTADTHQDLIKQVLLKKYRSHVGKYAELLDPGIIGEGKLFREVDTILKDLQNNSVLRLNELLTRNYYQKDTLFDVNNRVSKYVEEYYSVLDMYSIGNTFYYTQEIEDDDIPEYEKIEAFFTEEVIRDYYEYVKPILIKNSFFDRELRTDLHSRYEYINEAPHRPYVSDFIKKKLLRDFLAEILPIVKNKAFRNPKISDYEAIIRKYIVDKYVEIKPCGIQIREGAAIKSDPDKLFILYDSNGIDLSVISSGERKILIIFAIALFEEGFLFLDEPELSLSLVWQESILPDILKYGNAQGIFVATHSPYISRADELEQYLTFLPQRNN